MTSFFKLPLEKQRRIINAAYKVFSENSYKKPQCQKLQTRAVFQKRCFSTTLQTKKNYICTYGRTLLR